MKKKISSNAGDTDQQQNICLPCVRYWVRTPAPQEKKPKSEQNTKESKVELSSMLEMTQAVSESARAS